jgi:hypothetical protein
MSTEGILTSPAVQSGDSGTATYQIFAKTPAFNQTNYTMLDGLLPSGTSSLLFGAWAFIWPPAARFSNIVEQIWGVSSLGNPFG